MERKSAWKRYDAEMLARMEAFSNDYRTYLDHGKTERECVSASVEQATAHGFADLDEIIARGGKLTPGDRVYRNWMNKCFMMFVVGSEPIERGMNILGAHIDSPRLDVKQNPIYESDGIAYFDTHYYGGIKKYHWLAMPLALHGVVVRKDGTTVNVVVGEADDDPVFFISDLLPHLAREQMSKSAGKVIEGEQLDLIVASRPDGEEEKEPIKAALLKLLGERYGIEEADFLSAELEIVPAGKTREAGFDRSMILGYGHDDRVCAYPSLAAVRDFEGVPARTLCCVLTDKEEIGSIGATGMESKYFENTVAELCALTGEYSELHVRRALANSRMLSSDVSACYDPTFPGAYEKKNSAFLGGGLSFNKFTGSGGKGGSSDANAEFVAEVRRLMDDADVAFQMTELGKVDVGGGGTIAYVLAGYGMNVIDSGIPVLSMHAPWEAVSKVDLYEAYRGYCAFLRGAGAERAPDKTAAAGGGKQAVKDRAK